MGPTQAKPKPRRVHLSIEQDPKTKKFQYSAHANGNAIPKPKHLKLYFGESITFESSNSFYLSFPESPFEPAGNTVLHAKPAGTTWAVPASIRDDAEHHKHYPYTVYMVTDSDNSMDDPEILLEQVS